MRRKDREIQDKKENCLLPYLLIYGILKHTDNQDMIE